MADSSKFDEKLPSPWREKEKLQGLDALPWFTCLAIGVCVYVFVGIAGLDGPLELQQVTKFGYRSGTDIWAGQRWGLLTSAFVHIQLWHFLFNVCWLWVLGRRLEQEIGAIRYLLLFVVAAGVSSSAQLAFSDDTGIGASGVVYAMFGFMLRTRSQYSSFEEILTDKLIRWLLWWLPACVLLTYTGLLQIANAAHFFGFFFGWFVGGSFAQKVWYMRVGLAFVLVTSITSAFWAPWSVAWHSTRAYELLVDDHIEEALVHLDYLIDREPSDAWAWKNRSIAKTRLGDHEGARADYLRARELDPSIEEDWK